MLASMKPNCNEERESYGSNVVPRVSDKACGKNSDIDKGSSLLSAYMHAQHQLAMLANAMRPISLVRLGTWTLNIMK